MRNKNYFEMACKMEKQSTKRNTAMKNPDQWLKQGLEPWVGESPCVFILGTLPSDVSIKSQAYYQNKSHNSFYKIMERLFLRLQGQSDKEFITSNHIALWDCMKKAEREGNLDANIKNSILNDIEGFLCSQPSITTIVLNGGCAKKTFYKHFSRGILNRGTKVIPLISTSNCASRKDGKPVSFDEKFKDWSVIKEIINAST